MRHVPHVYVRRPWAGDVLEVPDAEVHHLNRVLRRTAGSAVTYTDGSGTVGSGFLVGGAITRGEERTAETPPQIAIVASPPRTNDRVRFLVEKLGELGVSRLVWLASARNEGRPPKRSKLEAWTVSALQQSRGAYLLEVDGPVGWQDLGDPAGFLVADPGGVALGAALVSATSATVVIGPEGGFDEGEVPAACSRVDLGRTVLRTETAAIVAAALAIEALDHRP